MILIGVDQGTTGTRTVAFDERLEPVAEAYRRVAVTHPQPGWISKDAREVVRSVEETVAEVVAAVGGAERVDAIGLDNEGETVVAWDPATGEPLADAVVWGCRRSQPIVERLAAHGDLVERRSGLPLDPYFTSTKIRWLIENVAGVDGRHAVRHARRLRDAAPGRRRTHRSVDRRAHPAAGARRPRRLG